ncbi:acyltransferase [Limosilactobacillus equigenerosi]|uniref:Membrane protein n=1 Tax=Limosilactobacillus equigenerosi DSM 18793 = JCM 14505 TaxID=1423742 RepID=A0A0R1UR13_9LACO|nr:acyltransferase [Limosilactobacillus equigenerosi]KRL95236.1 membrane protein [Limosilactobacillus equigenerosi DSM 18793 = JCM 14505]
MKRYVYIDIVNCLAIFLVIVQHTAQIAHFGNPNALTTILANVIQVVALPAVGLFFMNSGATNLSYLDRYSTKIFFKRRILKTVVPLLFWSVFFYLYSYKYYAFPGVIHHPQLGLHDFIQRFSDNRIDNLFWFFFVIIQLYLATPLLAVVAKFNELILKYSFYVGMIVAEILPNLFAVLGFKYNQTNLGVPILTGSWVIYYVFGYLVKNDLFTYRESRIIYGLGFIVLIVNILNALTKSEYLVLNHVTLFFYTASLYLGIKYLTERFDLSKWANGFKLAASATLGIYILHPLALEFLDLLFFKVDESKWSLYLGVLRNPIHVLIWPFIIYFSLVPIVIGLRKFKPIRYILP